MVREKEVREAEIWPVLVCQICEKTIAVGVGINDLARQATTSQVLRRRHLDRGV